jgi:hypothetical protein
VKPVINEMKNVAAAQNGSGSMAASAKKNGGLAAGGVSWAWRRGGKSRIAASWHQARCAPRSALASANGVICSVSYLLGAGVSYLA